MNRPKFRRMCGGGLWRVAYPFRGFTSIRRAAGAVIWDWPGVAFVYDPRKGDWG